MKKKFLKFLPIALLATLAVSCSDSDSSESGGNGGDGEVESSYVVSGTVDASYILTAKSLSEGEVTVKNNGLEAEDAAYWIYFNNKYLYRLAYNQGEKGLSSSYIFQTNGKLKERDNQYKISRFTSYGIYDNIILTSSTGDTNIKDSNGYIAKGFLFNELNVANDTFLPVDKVILSENYLGTGEYVTLAGYQKVGNKVFTAPIPMGLSQFGVKANGGEYVRQGYQDLVKTESGGTNSSSYLKDELQWTQYPDQAWIAIYPSLDFTQEPKLIKTEKISYATGRFKSQYYQTMWSTGNGDIYVFSPSYAKTMTDARQKTKLPAGVVRIAAGTEDFDDYYCNIEALSNGKSFMRCWYVSDNYFLMQMYDKPLTETGFQALELAIFNATTKELKPISGIPNASEITAIGNTPYMENGVAYVPITTTTGKPAVYKVDVKTATASVGLLMDATQISSVGKLIATK